MLLFGPETGGLRQSLLHQAHIEQAHSRAINLSNAIAIGLYEALLATIYTASMRIISPLVQPQIPQAFKAKQ